MAKIEVRDCVFSYDDKIDAVKGISFDVQEGSYTTIIGHNGSGKSTIAKLLIGLLEKKSGSIRIDGMELNEENLYDIRDKIGIVFQNPDNQIIGTVVEEDVGFGPENLGVPSEEIKQRVSDALKRAGFVWGIGTELYSAPQIKVPKEKCTIKEYNGKYKNFDRFTVEKIAYNDAQEISGLSILCNGKRCFVWQRT